MLRTLLVALYLLVPAVAAAQQKPAAARSVAQWAERLEDKDVRARWYATSALGQMGPEAAGAVPALMKVLENQYEHEYVRGGAAWALGRIGQKSGEAVGLLTETLTSKHVSVRRNAARALGRIGAPAKPAVPGLVGLLEDDQTPVRVNAAEALWQIDRSPQALPQLIEMLRGEEPQAAYLAAVALGRLGAEVEGTVEPLVEALGSTDGDLRRAAARSLAEIGTNALPALEKALESSDEKRRRSAVAALGRIGSAAVPALIGALADGSPAVKMRAARALGGIGPDARQAVAALIEATNDPQREVREEAGKALKRVRQTAVPAKE